MAVIFPFLLIEGKLTLDNVIDGITVILALKWGDLFYQFIDQNTKGPKINPLVVTSSCEHFRGTIVRRPSHGEHFFAWASLKTFATTAKVNQDRPFIFSIVQNVFGLYVSVANVSLVNVLQPLDNFKYYVFEFLYYDEKIPLHFIFKSGLDWEMVSTPLPANIALLSCRSKRLCI